MVDRDFNISLNGKCFHVLYPDFPHNFVFLLPRLMAKKNWFNNEYLSLVGKRS